MSVGDFGPAPGGTGLPLEGSQQTQAPGEIQQAPPSQPGAYDAALSTLENSLAEALIKAPNASIPFLIPPGMVSFNQLYQALSSGNNSDAQDTAIKAVQGAIILQIAHTQSEIISDILDMWSKSIQEQVKRAEEKALDEVTINLAQNTSRSGAEYEAWLDALPPQTKAEIIEIGKNGNLQAWFLEGLSSYVNGLSPSDQVTASAASTSPISIPDNASAIVNPLATSPDLMPLVTGALVLGINLTAITSTDPSTAKQIGGNPYQDAFTTISPAAGLATDYTAAAAMVASLIGRAVTYSSPIDTLEKAAQPGPAPHNMDFAKDYADSMVALVSGPGFNNFVMAMVIQKLENAPALNPEQQKDLLNATKTVLLATSLVLLYRAFNGGKAELGGMTGEEFLNLLKTPIKDQYPTMREDIQESFQSNVDALLASLPQDAGMAQNVLNALADFIDTRPKVDELLDVATVFRGLHDQLPGQTRVVAGQA